MINVTKETSDAHKRGNHWEIQEEDTRHG
jgi:hypothetical protein